MEHKVLEGAEQLLPGLTISPLSTGMCRVTLHYSADPVVSQPEMLDELAALLGGRDSWRWKKEMELDWDAQSGEMVFETQWLGRQRPYIRNPIGRMDIDAAGALARRPSGRVKVFIDPTVMPDGVPVEVQSVQRTFAMGIDVGAGTGASDSTIEVFCVQGREEAASFASNHITPSDLGRLAVAIGRFYNDALICCVLKMHGVTAIRAMVDLGYPHIWRSRDIKQRTEVQANQLGWPKGELSDKLLLDEWRDALAADPPGTILHDFETLEQHRQYLYDDAGRATLSRMLKTQVSGRQQHGDRVVACALANRACMDLPKQKNAIMRARGPNSFEGRRKQWETQQLLETQTGW